MANAGTPGVVDTTTQHHDVHDGTMARAQSPLPGSIGQLACRPAPEKLPTRAARAWAG